jgi:DNA polymerase-3 subunit epsilon
MVRVEAGEVVCTETRLIRPPRRRFMFTSIHGITWEQVSGEPPFEEVWPQVEPLLEGASFLAAHNAAFDRSVLEACCQAAGLTPPDLPFLCTVKLARRRWPLPRARLPDVCEHLGIPLQHHDATSDALACARIVLASLDVSPR